MPAPSTGSLRNAKALLKRFGRAFTLSDGSVMKGVYRSNTEDSLLAEPPAERFYGYHVWYPYLLRHGVFPEGHAMAGQNGRRVDRGEYLTTADETTGSLVTFYVVDLERDYDGWIDAVVTISSSGDIPEPSQEIPLRPSEPVRRRGFSDGFSRGFG